MSMPTIPDINPNIDIDREDAINIMLSSIAMEELAMAHILNAEGEKIQYVLGTLKSADGALKSADGTLGNDPGEVTICDVLAVNQSVQNTFRNVIKNQMLLHYKLEDIMALSDVTSQTDSTCGGGADDQ